MSNRRIKYSLSGGFKRAQLKQIHQMALRILEEVGIEIHSQEISEKELLAKISSYEGVIIRNDRICFAPFLVERYLKEYQNGMKPLSAKKKGGITVMGTCHTFNVLDPETDRLRVHDASDLVRATQLMDSFYDENVRGGCPGIPADVPASLQHLMQYKICCEHSRSLPSVPIASVKSAEYIHEMAQVMGYASPDSYGAGVHPVSPLRLEGVEFEIALHFFKKFGKKLVVSCGPMPIMGVSAPIFFPAALAQAMAEGLAGFVFFKLLTDGGNVGFGFNFYAFDMKYGNFAYGGPEDVLIAFVRNQMCRWYGFQTNYGAKSLLTMSHQPDAQAAADERTMGMTCLFQTRKCDAPRPFEPPAWACHFNSCDELPYGIDGHRWWQMGYWWVELGGEHHGIHDAELLRRELLRIAYGVWDHIKNHCPMKKEAENWTLEWIQFLPGKRESRRYIGAHVLTQNDIESEGRFDDIIAYGGWSMDDHNPAGFNSVRIKAPSTIFHPAPSPYGIPFRCLYSRNISNLMFAGRDASCTHAAMSSTRIMGTCCNMGQAAGAAAAMAVEKGILPRDMPPHIDALQQTLLRDDVYIPWLRQRFSPLTNQSRLVASRGNPEPVRDGINRPVGNDLHSWECGAGDHLAYMFTRENIINSAVLILESGLDRNIAMSYHGAYNCQAAIMPGGMPKAFRVEGLINGQWLELARVDRNRRRMINFRIDRKLAGIRFVLEAAYGNAASRVFAFYIE